ncbi:hypothetical protein [Halosolutus gelatinilyticus]|uniref:hypothetical protein n=1 Tax=Halosolutus gelatinilyticus TaxID=2931975 RepID=UPI001FF3BB0B|nr:hypothetical protein [Halosolutus gelatinilyticus]
MPANAPYTVTKGDDVLEIELISEDLESRRNVYFTDQSPVFEIRAENISNRPVEGSTTLRFSFEESENKIENGVATKIELDLEPGESKTVTHQIRMLPYQGTAAVTVRRCRVRDQEDRIELQRISNRYKRIYTFMVYDRDYYKVNYLWPRRAQYIAAFLSVLIVLVGILQLTG